MSSDSIDLRDVLAGLSRNPLRTLDDLTSVIEHNVVEHWWSLVIVLALGWWINHSLRKARSKLDLVRTVRTDGRSSRRAHAQRTMLISFGSILFWLTFLVLLFGQIGITMSSQTFGWFIGSLSLTAVFVLRPYLADALAGWVALAGDRYGVGDYLDTGFGVAGTVISVDMWTTRLRGADGTIYHLRNSELDRYGNRTRASGRILTDVELTKASGSFVTSDDVSQWEIIATEALVGLRALLRDVDAVARQGEQDDVEVHDVPAVASTVTALIPNLASDTMSELRAMDADDTGVIPRLSRVIAQSPVGATPLFKDIEILGLVTSTPSSVTIRIRVMLVDPRSRSYALTVLRRHVFDAFNPHNVSAGFSDVPEGEFIN